MRLHNPRRSSPIRNSEPNCRGPSPPAAPSARSSYPRKLRRYPPRIFPPCAAGNGRPGISSFCSIPPEPPACRKAWRSRTRPCSASWRATPRPSAFRPDDTIVSWLPLYHDMGLIAGFLMPLLSGIPLVLMSPFDWVRAPYKLLQAVSQHRGTLSWLPNFAYNFCAQKIRDRDLEGVDLSSWRAVINCSEPMHYQSHRMFLERFRGARAAGIGARHLLRDGRKRLRRHPGRDRPGGYGGHDQPARAARRPDRAAGRGRRRGDADAFLRRAGCRTSKCGWWTMRAGNSPSGIWARSCCAATACSAAITAATT